MSNNKISDMNKDKDNKDNKCNYCNKNLSTKYRLAEHLHICKMKYQHDLNVEIEKLKEKVEEMRQHYEERLMLYIDENESLKKQLQFFEQENKQDRRITEEWLKENVDHLSIEHIKSGPVGYATFLCEHILKNRVLCTDISRKKFKYLNHKSEWTIDPELLALSSLLFPLLKDRHKHLSSQYLQHLSNQLTDVNDINSLSHRMEIAQVFSDHERLLFKMLEGERGQYYTDLIRYLSTRL